MKKSTLLVIGISLLAVAVGGCGQEEAPPPAEQATAEAEAEAAREAAEAERRAAETEALAARLAETQEAIREMGSAATSTTLPRELEVSIAGLEDAASSPQRLLEELRREEGDAWAAQRDRVEEALDELQGRVDQVAGSLGEWRQREEETADARESLERPLDPESGLIQGLDGGLYDRYLVSVIEDVQRELRARGLYAGQVDGYLDTVTQEAIGEFQEKAGLAVSGVPSPMTRSRLFEKDESS